MDYNLALALKEGGFPQKKNGLFVTSESYIDKNGDLTTGDMITAPTLSELIEACIDFPNHFSLYGREGDRWEATLVVLKQPWEGDKSFHAKGATEEEAVARLWLELNKK